jgi:WD40 repeat protein
MKNRISSFILIIGLSIQPAFAQVENDTEYQLYLTQIAAAEAFFQLNKISEANFYLNACDEKYRNLEWRFLKKALDQSEMSRTSPENHYYTEVKISPAGNLVAVASTDSTITLFSYPDFIISGELKGHKSSVSTLAFSNNGKKIASGGRDHTVIVWDVETKKPISTNGTSFSQGIYQLKFSPNDSLIGVVSWERIPNRPPGIFGFAKLLDATTGKEVLRIELDNHPAAGIVFTPDKENIIISTWGEISYSYNLRVNSFNWKFDLSDPKEYNAFHSIDIHPEGNLVALGSTDHRVYILDLENG